MLKRSISIKGHRTSIALERVFWEELDQAAEDAAIPLPQLIARIDRARFNDDPAPGLASALRQFVVNRLREKSANADRTTDALR